jgi:perosamine synthetase
MTFQAQDYIARLSSFYPREGRWPLHEPLFDGNEVNYVKECVVTGWVSSVGAYVNRFEKDIATITGAKRAVAVVNGTAAIEVALSVAGVIAGDEVIVPGITFVATANAIQHLGAIAHFGEIEEESLGLDPLKLRDFLEENTQMAPRGRLNTKTGRVISAIVPVHIFGFACQIEEICKIGEEFGLEVVEDAAEGLGSSFAGKHVGRFGRFGALSFNGNKIITCGGGGGDHH